MQDMNTATMPIGVIDSGVGGLTSVAELRKLLPNEDIIYCGDNGNAPYGNRTGQNIVELTKRIFAFLDKQQVKAVAVACNTISSTFDSSEYGFYEKGLSFPVVSVIKPAVEDVLQKKYAEVGVVATVFTIKTGCHKQMIQARNPRISVYGEPSENLAELIEQGDLSSPAIQSDVKKHVNNLLSEHPNLQDIILGCTHYPIVQSVFEKAAPNVTFINPARDQAEALKQLLHERNLLQKDHQGEMSIYTSGSEPVYHAVLAELGISPASKIHTVRF